MSHIRHYRVLPWATEPLTLLETIAKVPEERQSRQNGQIVYLLTSSFLQHDSTITAEAITIQTGKNSINHWVDQSYLTDQARYEVRKPYNCYRPLPPAL